MSKPMPDVEELLGAANPFEAELKPGPVQLPSAVDEPPPAGDHQAPAPPPPPAPPVATVQLVPENFVSTDTTLQSPSTIQLSQPSKFLQTNIVDFSQEIQDEMSGNNPSAEAAEGGMGAAERQVPGIISANALAPASAAGGPPPLPGTTATSSSSNAQYFSIGSPKAAKSLGSLSSSSSREFEHPLSPPNGALPSAGGQPPQQDEQLVEEQQRSFAPASRSAAASASSSSTSTGGPPGPDATTSTGGVGVVEAAAFSSKGSTGGPPPQEQTKSLTTAVDLSADVARGNTNTATTPKGSSPEDDGGRMQERKASGATSKASNSKSSSEDGGVAPPAAPALPTLDPWRRVHEVQEEKQVIQDSLQQAIQQLTAENENLKKAVAQKGDIHIGKGDQGTSAVDTGGAASVGVKLFNKIAETLDSLADDSPSKSAASNADPPEPPAFVAAFVNFYGGLRTGLASTAASLIAEQEEERGPPQLVKAPPGGGSSTSSSAGSSAASSTASSSTSSPPNPKKKMLAPPPPPTEFKPSAPPKRAVEMPPAPAEFAPAPPPPAPPAPPPGVLGPGDRDSAVPSSSIPAATATTAGQKDCVAPGASVSAATGATEGAGVGIKKTQALPVENEMPHSAAAVQPEAPADVGEPAGAGAVQSAGAHVPQAPPKRVL